jgi:predicted DNA-binding transcriptional regulator AlpA
MNLDRVRHPLALGPGAKAARAAELAASAPAPASAEDVAVGEAAEAAPAAPTRRRAARSDDASGTPAFAGLLKPGEAAAIIGVSRSLLEHWRKRGEGPSYVRLSRRHVMYRREHLEAFIEKCTVCHWSCNSP